MHLSRFTHFFSDNLCVLFARLPKGHSVTFFTVSPGFWSQFLYLGARAIFWHLKTALLDHNDHDDHDDHDDQDEQDDLNDLDDHESW